MIDSEARLNEVLGQLERDLVTLFQLVFTHNKPVNESAVRTSSVILRKWLLDGVLQDILRATGAKVTLPVLDNAKLLNTLISDYGIDYFLTGGVRFWAVPVMAILYSPNEPGTAPLPDDRMEMIDVTLRDFLRQTRIYHDGRNISCENIVRFMANKLGGAHLDFEREGQYAQLESAANFMIFGGPPIEQLASPPENIYNRIDPHSSEVLSGFHLEVIAAATSLIHLKINDEPLMELTTHRTWLSRIRYLLFPVSPGWRLFRPRRF